MPRMKLLSKPSKARAKTPKAAPVADGPVNIVLGGRVKRKPKAPATNPAEIAARDAALRRKLAAFNKKIKADADKQAARDLAAKEFPPSNDPFLTEEQNAARIAAKRAAGGK